MVDDLASMKVVMWAQLKADCSAESSELLMVGWMGDLMAEQLVVTTAVLWEHLMVGPTVSLWVVRKAEMLVVRRVDLSVDYLVDLWELLKVEMKVD